ncbi:rod shape-determining protein MreC [Rhodothalassium salexigens DSM 2132]|uniref:Cell shape-determining protein MreC n=1 Tax=Rhodothalassium salexigens DSM 2132 TaxID=1188247 RepID=A0A4R2P7A3_RHOSA|nr:rod shape-determining protein MreC [Rhodothalassium salexigens]MBB4212592.1 rod shape-determining protein MreC [Rhodothalassium salexigens DSM 2132]MBK1639649.1 rod shape-determining protein MreC [Rhodothalassium salexigens DSM 2132]TCP30810.1 rod shape-determining protein MreC [Rhodothalassium salexigens DSM 2132]
MARAKRFGRGGATPLKERSGTVLAAAILVVALVLVILNRVEHPLVRDARRTLTDLTAPVMTVLSAPVRKLRDVDHWFAGLADIQTENARLTRENERLRQMFPTIERLEMENRRLRRLLNMTPPDRRVLATAQVIAMPGGAFVRNVIIDAGRRQGLERGLPVTDEQGLVGRLIEVGLVSARVLLVTDLNSRIPVVLPRTGQPGIAVGRNGPLMSLDFVGRNADVRLGDRIVTSGHGGVYPPGLLLGVLVEDGGVLKVRPSAALGRLDLVQVRPGPPPAPEDSAEPAALGDPGPDAGSPGRDGGGPVAPMASDAP